MANNDWEPVVSRLTNLCLARLQNCTETGDSVTVRLKGIIKLAKDDSGIRLLQRHRKILGTDYLTAFPDFRCLGLIEGYHVVELEYLGDWTLEDALLGKVEQQRDSYFQKGIELIGDGIRLLSRHELPSEEQLTACQAFVKNLVHALVANAQAASINIDKRKLNSAIHEAQLRACLCHNDFSTVNIICRPDSSIRLIDPRWVTPGGIGYDKAPFGSSAIDCATIFVSLERKDLERKALGLRDLELSQRIKPIIDEMMANQLFNQQTLDLCLAQAYAVYCACRCSYCLEQERSWLYDKMRQGLIKTLHRL